jgi:hypothetical protein
LNLGDYDMKCISCKGTGKSLAFFGYRGEGKPCIPVMVVTCNRCDGSGGMPLKALLWIFTGSRMRKRRVKAGMTFRQASLVSGVDVKTLSRMEIGYIKPDPSLYKKMEDDHGEIKEAHNRVQCG